MQRKPKPCSIDLVRWERRRILSSLVSATLLATTPPLSVCSSTTQTPNSVKTTIAESPKTLRLAFPLPPPLTPSWGIVCFPQLLARNGSSCSTCFPRMVFMATTISSGTCSIEVGFFSIWEFVIFWWASAQLLYFGWKLCALIGYMHWFADFFTRAKPVKQVKIEFNDQHRYAAQNCVKV